MRKMRFILILMSVLLAGACTRLEEQKTALNIYVRFPEEVTATKTEGINWSALFAKETRINDLRIWVFVNKADGIPAGTLLGYLEPKQLILAGGKVQKFTVTLDKAVAKKIELVDVYVLGNSSPLGLIDLGEKTTPAELDAMKFTGDQFGIADDGLPVTTDVTDAVGLPYTAVGRNLKLSGTGADLSVANVELVRAVSKVQFVFCQIQDGETLPVNFVITSLKLNKDLIPEEEYLFNDNEKPMENPKIGKNYVSRELSFKNLLPVKDDVAGSTTPSGYAYNNEPDYLDKINTALINGEVTGMAPCYLRESDKALSGEIQYTVDNVTKEPVKFSMVSGQKFARNSCWIVYFYFNNDILTISVSPTNWTSGGEFEIIGE